MSFETPLLLVIGLAVVAALVVAAVVFERRRAAALASAGLVPLGRGGRAGLWLSLAGIALLAVASAGPTATVPVPRAAGTVIIAMDVSASMGADDVEPTRLAAAQQAAIAFIDAQPDTVDIGVVAFQQGALTTAAPSADHAAAAAAIDRLAIAGGTSLGDAILTSLSAITGETVTLGEDGTAGDLGYWGSATIVLFSDGEDSGGSTDAATAAAVAQAAGVHIQTVGVGTTSGAVVEVDGYRLLSTLDEDALRQVAQATGGSYRALADAAGLDEIASTIDLRLDVADDEVPLAGALSLIALVLLGLGAVLTVLRTGRIV